MMDDTYCLCLLKYAEFLGDVDLPCFAWEIHCLGKFGQKNQNLLFKIKFVT